MNAQKQKNWGPLHVLGLKNNDLERISNKSIKRFSRNIVWQTLKQETHIEQANCMVVPILIHQHHNGAVVFPHFRCHIVVEGLSNLLLQDISFEQWVEL